MKNFIIALIALNMVSSILSARIYNPRLLTNTENDKVITLSAKQWGIIAGIGIVVFILCFFVLGLICSSPPKTRDVSATLTSDLIEQEQIEEQAAEIVEVGRLYLFFQPLKFFQSRKMMAVQVERMSKQLLKSVRKLLQMKMEIPKRQKSCLMQ